MNYKSYSGEFEVVEFLDSKGKTVASTGKGGKGGKKKRSLDSEDETEEIESCASGPTV